MLDHSTRNEVLTSMSTMASAMLHTAAAALGAELPASTAAPATTATTPASASDVAAAVMDAEPEHDQATPTGTAAAAATDVCGVPKQFGRLALDRCLFSSDSCNSRSSSFRLSAVDESGLASCSSCGSCYSDAAAAAATQDDGSCDQRPKVARRWTAHHPTYDLVASSSALNGAGKPAAAAGDADVAMCAAATVAAAATAAAANGAAAALLAAAAGPAGLLTSYQQCASCHQAWEEQQADWKAAAAPAGSTSVERRYTVH